LPRAALRGCTDAAIEQPAADSAPAVPRIDGDQQQNVALEAGDEGTLFSKSQITGRRSRQQVLVRLEGEFLHAGVYQAEPGETLRQLVLRAGGLTPEAYVFGSAFTRISTQKEQEQRLKQVIEEAERDLRAAQVLRSQGARVTISGMPADRRRLDIAASLGLAVVDAADLSDATPAGGFDVVADASGNERGIDAGLRAVRKGGHYVQVGLTGKPISVDIDLVCLKELVVTSGFASTPRSWRRLERLVADGHVVLDPLVTDVLPLSDWQTAFERTRPADGLKLVLDPRRDAPT